MICSYCMVYKKVKSIDKKFYKEENKPEVFYLEKIVSQKNAENQARRQLQIEKINKKCQLDEEKDQKYIDELKTELLAKYKKAQESCQRKIELAKKKALAKIEASIREEEARIDELCRIEVVKVITLLAKKDGWFNVAMRLYRNDPDLFNKKDE